MNPDDTSRSVYAVAFKDGRFLMVYNPKRKGWEMPGGHIRVGESVEDAAVREFKEESGYDVEIVKIRFLGHCYVCAARLGERTSCDAEMETRMFDTLPDELAFDRAEYDDTVPWSKSEIYG